MGMGGGDEHVFRLMGKSSMILLHDHPPATANTPPNLGSAQ